MNCNSELVTVSAAANIIGIIPGVPSLAAALLTTDGRSQRRLSSYMHELYKVYDDKGTLLYVGVTIDVLTRMKQHRRESLWYRAAAVIRVWVYPDRMTALDGEARVIAAEAGLYSGWCQRELLVAPSSNTTPLEDDDAA